MYSTNYVEVSMALGFSLCTVMMNICIYVSASMYVCSFADLVKCYT